MNVLLTLYTMLFVAFLLERNVTCAMRVIEPVLSDMNKCLILFMYEGNCNSKCFLNCNHVYSILLTSFHNLLKLIKISSTHNFIYAIAFSVFI